jgi:alpha,alpha-trehalase
MKQALRPLTLLLITITAASALPQSSQSTSSADEKILTYIDHGWDTLSRSMTDCKSLADPKVTTTPILYLPAGMPIPARIASVPQRCKIEVRNLPRKIPI